MLYACGARAQEGISTDVRGGGGGDKIERIAVNAINDCKATITV